MVHTRKMLISCFLALIVMLIMMPQLTERVHADSGDPAMTLGTAVINNRVNTDNAYKVWYGDNSWRLIGYNGSGAASVNGAATLLASSNINGINTDCVAGDDDVQRVIEMINALPDMATPKDTEDVEKCREAYESFDDSI